MFSKRFATSLLAFALLTPMAAQAQEITGKWTATYPAMTQRRNSEEAVTNGTALVTIEQKGDSIFGTWLPQNTPTPATLRSFRGTFVNGQLTFVGSPVAATVRRGGDESTIQMITYYEGTFKDGVIEGTMRAESSDGTIRTSPQKWSAKR